MSARRLWTTGLPLLASTFLASCGDGTAGTAGSGEGPPRWSVESPVRIGSVDDPEQSLVAVGGVAIGPEGNLYILQPQDAQVRVHAPTGELLRRIGRRGEGPGEFGAISSAAFRGDTLYVSDRSPNRLSFFALDGAFLASEAWPSEAVRTETASFLTTAPQVLLPDGSGLVMPGVAVPRLPATDGVRTSTLEMRVFRATREPASLDTVFRYQMVNVSNSVPVGDGTTIQVTCPFQRYPLVQPMVDGRGVLVVDRTPAASLDPSEVPVTLISPAGDTVFSTRVRYQPVPVAGERLAREIEVVRTRQTGRGAPAPAAADVERALREAGCLPVAVPPADAAMTAQDGTVWLRFEEAAPDSAAWVALGADGAPLARIRLSAGERVAAVLGDVLVTTEIDALGVPFVTRYRLVR